MIQDVARILLIDLENCQGHIENLLNDLEKFSKVILCYAKTNAKIPLDWLATLSEVMQQGQLDIVKMSQTGKDSADFGLSFLAGRLSVQHLQPSHFVILSDDKALDYVIDLLKSHGHSAMRKSGKVSNTVLTDNQSSSNEPIIKKESSTAAAQKQAIYKYCGQLYHVAKKAAHPKSRQALLNMMKSSLKNEALAKKVLHDLITSSALQINANDVVSLNLEKIEALAKMAK